MRTSGLAAAILYAGIALSPPAESQVPDGWMDRRQAQEARGPDHTPSPAYRAGQVRHSVAIDEGVWHDQSRGGRAVAWRLYYPQGAELMPVLIFSHGGGGSREGGAYLGAWMASFGYASFHIQHSGTDIEHVRGAVRDARRGPERREAARQAFQDILAAVNDPTLAEDRFRDISFTAAHLGALPAQDDAPGWSGALDLARLGVYGHSFGAITALVAAGQSVEGFGRELATPGVGAVAVLSPSPPRPGYGSAETAFSTMNAPIFHATGSRDGAPDGRITPEDRLTPFELIDSVDQYLLVLDGADHMALGGRSRGGGPVFEGHVDALRQGVLAFFDAELLDDLEARAFLAPDGPYARSLGLGDRYTVKPAH
ncbi:MAG: hypothetical protein NXI12_13265 [Alphaproteobacteria bacterium]|nr:hypothetical protein [Alphaproteobacteria bacterium]